MNIKDYIRLASAGLWRQKRQTFKIVLIMGTMFAFILTIGFLFWGAKGVGISKINQPTGDGILVYLEAICGEQDDCKIDAVDLEESVYKYGGKVIEHTGSLGTYDGELDVLPEEVVERAVEIKPDGRPDDVTPILIPTRMAMEWLKIIDNTAQPTFNENEGVFALGPEATIESIKAVREQALGKTVVSPNNERYFVVGFLPSNVKTSFTVNSDSGFLNLFIDRTTAGHSKEPIVIGNDMMSRQKNRVWVAFKDASLVYDYYTSQEEVCDRSGSAQDGCRYIMVSPFGFEFDPKWSYGSTESLFRLVAIVFGTIATIVNIITLIRMAKRDAATEALYYAMGAKPGQIHIIQTLHMLILCLLASIFALLASMIACLVINLVYAETLAETYALSFGILESPVILFGLGWEILIIVGVILAAVPIAIIFSWKNNRRKLVAL